MSTNTNGGQQLSSLIRNPPERISANPIETQRLKVNSLTNSNYSSNGASTSSNTKLFNGSKTNTNGIAPGTRERLAQNYLGNFKKPVDLMEENFNSMKIGGAVRQQYNIITHEAIGGINNGNNFCMLIIFVFKYL